MNFKITHIFVAQCGYSHNFQKIEWTQCCLLWKMDNVTESIWNLHWAHPSIRFQAAQLKYNNVTKCLKSIGTLYLFSKFTQQSTAPQTHRVRDSFTFNINCKYAISIGLLLTIWFISNLHIYFIELSVEVLGMHWIPKTYFLLGGTHKQRRHSLSTNLWQNLHNYSLFVLVSIHIFSDDNFLDPSRYEILLILRRRYMTVINEIIFLLGMIHCWVSCLDTLSTISIFSSAQFWARALYVGVTVKWSFHYLPSSVGNFRRNLSFKWKVNNKLHILFQVNCKLEQNHFIRIETTFVTMFMNDKLILWFLYQNFSFGIDTSKRQTYL